VKISDVPYPLRLCVEMLHYCAMSNEKTEEMKSSEIKDNLLVFFTKDQIQAAQDILCGKG